jgi:hypothetical protein
MDGVEVLAFLSLLLLFAAGGLVLAIEMGRTSGRGSRIAAWLALTVLCLWAVFVVEFLVVNTVLFTFGREVAGVALVLSGVLLVLTPFATGAVIRHVAHHPVHPVH